MYAVPEAVGDGICRTHVLVCNLFVTIVDSYRRSIIDGAGYRFDHWRLVEETQRLERVKIRN